jgi:hypothetical protein
MMCPQENTHLSMVRVSKHLHTAVPALTDVLEEKKMKICLMHLQLTSNCQINVTLHISLPQNQHVFVFLHVPAHRDTSFTDIPMQIILLPVGKVLNYNLGT